MKPFALPGDYPLNPQSKNAAGSDRGRSSSGFKLAKTYGIGRICASCDSQLSRYNPDAQCRLCNTKGAS